MLLTVLLAGAATPLPAPDGPKSVEQAIASAGPGARIGIVVVDDGGREIVSLRPDDRFVPASNTKLYSTAVALATLGDAAPDTAGATVRLEGRDVVLAGHGDAMLSSAADCARDCLATLADAVAAKTRAVGDVIGDDTAFPDERWPQGMSWNNMVTRYGTAISALTIDDNELVLTVTPGAPGAAPAIVGDGYYTIENRAITGPAGTKETLDATRMPGSGVLRITGAIPAGAPPETMRVGIEDPAHRAAWRLATLLRARGVRVTGAIGVRHRPPAAADDPAQRGAAPAARQPAVPVLARLTPPPLAEDIRLTNKVSQNLHAELLIRRAGAVTGSGSVADGHAALDGLLAGAGVPRWQYDFADGSGMASYNRVTPRATVGLLRWAATQPWAATWRDSLPVAGVDGTLSRRFKGTPLEGRLFAKTGTLNQANALGGYMIAASGRTLTFAAYANDMPGDASATKAIDAALVAIAAAN